MILIIECKAPDYAYIEEYEVEIDYDAPRCCGGDMEYCGQTKKNKEIWQCPICEDTQSFYPGMYGSDFVTMTPQEYEDYSAAEQQKARLIERYGTDKPKSIRDYWTG